MLIIPAIDLLGGACVRLLQGRFDEVTRYGDPLVQLRTFAESGAAWTHVVDLDGAKAGSPVQRNLIGRLAADGGAKLQCGGGVRSRKHIAALLDSGVSRVVVGSVAAREPERVRDWITEFGVEHICLAFDVRTIGEDWEVVTDGWTAHSGKWLGDALDAFAPGGVAHALVTDISRDGALNGPNEGPIAHIRNRRPDIQLQASGGVRALADFRVLRKAGAAAAIVGRALYERCFTLEDALAL